jgi:hypothetical protein
MRRALKRLEECAIGMHGRRAATIERVIEIGLRPEHLERGKSTMWVLANPVPGGGSTLRWTAISPSDEGFREVVSDRMRRGYLPIGILDVGTRSGEAYIDLVPESYREDYEKFARANLHLACDALAGRASPKDPSAEDAPAIGYEIAMARQPAPGGAAIGSTSEGAEAGGRRTVTVMVYHVTDAGGAHRFLSMNSLSAGLRGGTDAFEAMLASQYTTVELLGATPVAVSEGDPPQCEMLDSAGAGQLAEQVKEAMAGCPGPCRGLEPWLPPAEECAPPAPPALSSLPWRPISSLKREAGNVDLKRVAVAFIDRDVCTMVKPEFVSAVRARGGALLAELKEEFRRKVEPGLVRALEARDDGPDGRGDTRGG